jgi:8-oxo-dGTP pyrophosphatase MutT (NUDIX family)
VVESKASRGPRGLTPGSFAERARVCLHAQPPEVSERGPSDFQLNPGLGGEASLPELRPAAVLIPVVARERLSVILTQRTAHLSTHAGQIAFPGGKLDDGESVVETALREAKEEIGLADRFVEPIGYLDWYRTRTGFAVSPLVALVQPGFTLRANPNEVEDVFEVPLEFLLDEENHFKHRRRWQGHDRFYYAMPYGERYIWGATAGIIRNLHQRLRHE